MNKTLKWTIGILAIFLIGVIFFEDSPKITSNVINEQQEGIIQEEQLENIPQPEINSNYLHFPNKTITFSMKGAEAPLKRKRMYEALEELENLIGEFNFVEINNYEQANIKIEFPIANNLNTIGEGGPTVNSKKEITEGKINIIKIADDCDYHGTEMHELLHVFGFDHRDWGIMYEYNDKCYNLQNSPEYIEHLKFIYSNGRNGKEHPELPMYKLNSFKFSCPEGTYEVEGTDYCCPEPNMEINTEGYCV